MLSPASFFGLTLCFVFVLLSPVAADFQLPNLHIYSEILFPRLTLDAQAPNFDFDLEKALPPASSTLTPLAVPAACAAYTGPGGECTAGMAATAVAFEDCGSAFTMCRCADANMTMDTAVDRLARVPVGLRRFLGTVFVLGGPTHAYTNLTNGDVHLFGDAAMDTWIHETAHAFDYAIPTDPHSNSAAWEKATIQDSCAPDTYALTNQVEDFAQMAVIKIYMLLQNGNLPPGFQSACMQKQLNFMAALPLFNATRLFGNTCAINDGQRGVRKKIGPKVLDATRTFKTVPVEALLPVKTPGAQKNSGYSHRGESKSTQWSGVAFAFLSSFWITVWFI
ncbi:hypothetical protein DFH09DRAFT_990604 [Mycena vulgaris]|nr:hypothetical protein DFH09DRAFT_990604 [Mycena vulgaris]